MCINASPSLTVPPVVEPVYTEIRQALGRAFVLSCHLLRAHPARLLRYEWKLGSRLLTVGQLSDQQGDTEYQVRALNREGYGEYTCDITNAAGAGRCTFLVTGEKTGPGMNGPFLLGGVRAEVVCAEDETGDSIPPLSVSLFSLL